MSPIIIFAFNRAKAVKVLVESLLLNPEVRNSDLYVFIDGPRKNKFGESDKVQEVRNYAATITGFKSVTINCSEENKGLGASIIAGVSNVMAQYGQAIVLEDDLYVQPNFLAYMNSALKQYADADKVFSVCGYSNKLHIPHDYRYDTYFCTRSSSWGWATWADRWSSVDWDLKDWDMAMAHTKGFNHWGGSDCLRMLQDWHKGKNKSWAIRFCFAQFLQNKFSIFPIKSLVRNDGFDGQGTNCKNWSRFHFDLMQPDKKNFSFPSDFTMNRTLYKQAMSYHSIPIRIYSRIMYLLHK